MSSNDLGEPSDLDEIIEKPRSKSYLELPRVKRSNTINPLRLATFDLIFKASSFSQRDPLLPCFLRKTHIKNQDFFSRRDLLRKLEETLLPSPLLRSPGIRENLKTFGLRGLGGVGKTEIAIAFMLTHRDENRGYFLSNRCGAWPRGSRCQSKSKHESRFSQEVVDIPFEIVSPVYDASWGKEISHLGF